MGRSAQIYTLDSSNLTDAPQPFTTSDGVELQTSPGLLVMSARDRACVCAAAALIMQKLVEGREGK